MPAALVPHHDGADAPSNAAAAWHPVHAVDAESIRTGTPRELTAALEARIEELGYNLDTWGGPPARATSWNNLASYVVGVPGDVTVEQTSPLRSRADHPESWRSGRSRWTRAFASLTLEDIQQRLHEAPGVAENPQRPPTRDGPVASGEMRGRASRRWAAPPQIYDRAGAQGEELAWRESVRGGTSARGLYCGECSSAAPASTVPSIERPARAAPQGGGGRVERPCALQIQAIVDATSDARAGARYRGCACLKVVAGAGPGKTETMSMRRCGLKPTDLPRRTASLSRARRRRAGEPRVYASGCSRCRSCASARRGSRLLTNFFFAERIVSEHGVYRHRSLTSMLSEAGALHLTADVDKFTDPTRTTPWAPGQILHLAGRSPILVHGGEMPARPREFGRELNRWARRTTTRGACCMNRRRIAFP